MLSRIRPVMLLFAVAIGIIFLINNYELFRENPLRQRYDLDNPVYLKIGADGNYYTIDKAMLRISVITPEGKVVREIRGGKKQGFFCAWQVTADKDSRMFVDDYFSDHREKSVEIEELVEISATGDERNVFFSNRHSWGFYGSSMMLALFNDGNDIGAWFIEKGFFVRRIADKNGKRMLERDRFEAKGFSPYENNYACSPDGKKLYSLEKNGIVYHLSTEGKKAVADSQGRVVFDLKVSDEGRPVVHDLDDGQLYLLEKKPRALLPANLVNRSEQYTPETTAYALLPDMSVVLAAKGGIFLIRDAKVVKALTKLKYSYALMGMRLSVWLVALALLGLSVYYFRFFMKTFYENRTPEILRDSVLIMLSIAFSALVVAGEIYGSMMDHYLRNTGNSLIQYTELAFEKIKPINLDAITSVRSYDSEDYRQLHDKIWRLLDAFDEQSGCPYYFMLYKFDGGKLREVLDTDTYGSGARFQVVPREFTNEVMKIIKAKPQDNDGRIVTSDTYAGKWMFTAKPVYGADGKLSGVFEVGTDLFSIEKTSMSILTEAILKTISFIIVFILIMLETISFRSRKETVKTRMSGSTVRMLMLLTVCSSMTSFSVVPLLAAGFKTTGLNISMAQAMALPGIVEMMLMIVVNLYGARLVERFGWMPQYITGMLLIASGSLMAFFSPDFMWFLASRILSGLGVGLAFNATKMLYAFEEDRSARMYVQTERNAGRCSGGIIGAFLGTMMYGFGMGMKVMLASSVMAVLAIAFTMILLRNIKSEAPAEREKNVVLNFLKAIFAKDAFPLMLLLVLPSMAVINSLAYIMSVFVHEQGMRPETIGRGIMISSLVQAWLAGPIIKLAIGKWGIRMTAAMGGFMMFGSIIILAFWYSLPALYIGAAINGIATICVYMPSMDYFMRTKAAKGLGAQNMASYYTMVSYIGGIVGSSAFGWLFKYGIRNGLLIGTIVAVVMIVIYCIVFFSGSGRKKPVESQVS